MKKKHQKNRTKNQQTENKSNEKDQQKTLKYYNKYKQAIIR